MPDGRQNLPTDFLNSQRPPPTVIGRCIETASTLLMGSFRANGFDLDRAERRRISLGNQVPFEGL